MSKMIGMVRESSLHADLKKWYACPQDRVEVYVDGYIIDIEQNGTLVEIQTGNFTQLKGKLKVLLQNHPVRIVYPIPREKWIVRETRDGLMVIGRRKSPKRGRVEDIFSELVRIPRFVKQSGFSLEVLFTQEEELWRDDGLGSWRRGGWSISDRRLINVVGRQLFQSTVDYRSLLPPTLPKRFTNRDLADILNLRLSLARKMTYCLRHIGVLKVIGKRGNAYLYSISV